MTETRQQILILHLAYPDLASHTVAWALYDGSLPADTPQMNTGDLNEPPYSSVLDAMRDGWFIIQMASMPVYVRGVEYEHGHLPFEYVLERSVEI
jgi:hypothetical protein